MTTATCRLGLLLALLALAAPARAQDASTEDPRAARFNDVERGLAVSFEAGYLTLFKTPTKDRVRFPYAGDGGGRSQGTDVTVTLGYDLTSRLAVSLFLGGANQTADASYGAFDLTAAGLDLRYAFWASKDRNGWERLFTYVHARGGLLTTRPRGLLGTSDTLVAGGAGVEYYTQLRHFSIGLQLDGLYLLSAKAPGLSFTPMVRYTF